MSSIQVADQTFVAAPPERIARSLNSPTRWRRWWPDLRLSVREDRADKGVRWVVDGPLTGTMEVWLEPVLDGAIIHYFVHAEPAGVAPEKVATLDLAALNRRRRVQGKQMSFEIKDELEAGRAAGEPPH
ncbi:polyketide cyclase / dehydrase and lipid transport [Rhodococcus triatomae]|uniref:polyketide cyclase / dehydrase and lipid transport n=1 Tax=Rhodococcus triatomae TaxID=300028 RepID=UPI000933257D|nr:polyketide cyclase / dehydrase and lipid transport [Rhodococcus triatomae]QNG18507.1 polyketide cyclase / dehydrase and lipid transport [Rhodococcus triatomae]QNG21824.1 polyketide cyclase / dehydrase and lipid transport [Rhodococcus triatomae]